MVWDVAVGIVLGVYLLKITDWILALIWRGIAKLLSYELVLNLLIAIAFIVFGIIGYSLTHH